MHCANKYVAALFVSAALLAPLGASALAPQDDHERHEREEHRVYDPYHKDYHSWDAREDEAYRHWLEGRHQVYVDYEHLKHKEQREYWNWRHEHEEHERSEHQ